MIVQKKLSREPPQLCGDPNSIGFGQECLLYWFSSLQHRPGHWKGGTGGPVRICHIECRLLAYFNEHRYALRAFMVERT